MNKKFCPYLLQTINKETERKMFLCTYNIVKSRFDNCNNCIKNYEIWCYINEKNYYKE